MLHPKKLGVMTRTYAILNQQLTFDRGILTELVAFLLPLIKC